MRTSLRFIHLTSLLPFLSIKQFVQIVTSIFIYIVHYTKIMTIQKITSHNTRSNVAVERSFEMILISNIHPFFHYLQYTGNRVLHFRFQGDPTPANMLVV